jgi:hypothetical protein
MPAGVSSHFNGLIVMRRRMLGLGDGSVVAVGEVVGRVGDRRRERGVEGVDALPVGVAGELEGWLGVPSVKYGVIIDYCHELSDLSAFIAGSGRKGFGKLRLPGSKEYGTADER